jgi:hypothetical protein
VWDGVVCVCLGGRSPLALEHSKVCTLCDFGHLQFFLVLLYKVLPSNSRSLHVILADYFKRLRRSSMSKTGF